jgi:hypothetical protein
MTIILWIIAFVIYLNVCRWAYDTLWKYFGDADIFIFPPSDSDHSVDQAFAYWFILTLPFYLLFALALSVVGFILFYSFKLLTYRRK